MKSLQLPADLASSVRLALKEDIGSGDLTAELIPAEITSRAVIISREPAILCGCAWFDEVFRQLDDATRVEWAFHDGDAIAPDVPLCNITGHTRALLTGERTALNFLQLLSGTATTTRNYVTLLGQAHSRLLDTRKTIPGLRSAQKYAVVCGGGNNHRMGLYDAILIKENHIQAAGGIQPAVQRARASGRRVEVEVEDLRELEQAIAAGTDTIMLDNFTLDMIREAVHVNQGRALLEVSGNVTRETLLELAATGVDLISCGDLTKNVTVIDFSMRIM